MKTKALQLLTIILVAIGIVGCSKPDDPIDPTITWKEGSPSVINFQCGLGGTYRKDEQGKVSVKAFDILDYVEPYEGELSYRILNVDGSLYADNAEQEELINLKPGYYTLQITITNNEKSNSYEKTIKVVDSNSAVPILIKDKYIDKTGISFDTANIIKLSLGQVFNPLDYVAGGYDVCTGFIDKSGILYIDVASDVDTSIAGEYTAVYQESLRSDMAYDVILPAIREVRVIVE